MAVDGDDLGDVHLDGDTAEFSSATSSEQLPAFFWDKSEETNQRNLAPVDVKLGSELLVAADGRFHLLAAAQLVVRALHLTQTRGERNVCANHHIHPEGKRGC